MSVDQVTSATRHNVIDIEAGKVREFAEAVHAGLDDEGRSGSPIIPPTFLTTLNFAISGEPMLSGFDLARTLHAGQEYAFEGEPPRAGMRLASEARITSRFERSGARGGVMDFAVESTEFRDETGALVATALMTSVETAPALSEPAPPSESEPPSGPVATEPAATASTEPRDAAPHARPEQTPPAETPGGGPAPLVIGPITRTDIVRYQGASGDFNPIHHDDAFAQAAGYPMAFAPGMFQAGLLASFATDWLGARNIRRFSVRFRDQVWPGDVLTCSGAIAGVSTDAPTGTEMVTVTLECRRQTGAVVITGWATFVLDGDAALVTDVSHTA